MKNLVVLLIYMFGHRVEDKVSVSIIYIIPSEVFFFISITIRRSTSIDLLYQFFQFFFILFFQNFHVLFSVPELFFLSCKQIYQILRLLSLYSFFYHNTFFWLFTLLLFLIIRLICKLIPDSFFIWFLFFQFFYNFWNILTLSSNIFFEYFSLIVLRRIFQFRILIFF